MAVPKNMEKYEAYKAMHENLTRALRAGFYYEAIFIEYAIFEDRLTSLLKYAKVPATNKKGFSLKISDKLRLVGTKPPFCTPFVQARLTPELLEKIRLWTVDRNRFIHNLANIPYDPESVRDLALRGNDLLKVFCAKARSVSNRHKKLCWTEE